MKSGAKFESFLEINEPVKFCNQLNNNLITLNIILKEEEE
jgi:hypothetical protein